MRGIIRLFVFVSLFVGISESVFSQTLKWTSSPRDDSQSRSGWFIVKNKPLELRLWQFDYNTNKLLIMDGALSNTPYLEITLSYSERFSYYPEGGDNGNDPNLDYNGDGFNDVIINANYPSPSRYGFRIVDFINGQTLFQLDDASYSYSFLKAFDLDGDGKIEIAVNRTNMSTNLTETLAYATNGSATSYFENVNNTPTSFQLKQNYPNPFNPSTTIEYEISQPSDVKINIYDVSGRLVKELINEQRNTGKFSIVWNGKDNSGNTVASGNYFYQIISGDFVQAKKMILLK